MKDKNKTKEKVPDPEIPDDGARPGSSSAKPEEAVEPSPAADPSGIPDEETEQPKKKKKKKNKKDPDLEKFRQQERENRAKEMARVAHWKLQRELDFRSVRNYRKKIPAELLDTINGADHSKFLSDKLERDVNYMSKRNKHRRNLMTIERLLSRIVKFAKDPEQRLKEAQAFIKSTFLKVQGMATVIGPLRNWSSECWWIASMSPSTATTASTERSRTSDCTMSSTRPPWHG